MLLNVCELDVVQPRGDAGEEAGGPDGHPEERGGLSETAGRPADGKPAAHKDTALRINSSLREMSVRMFYGGGQEHVAVLAFAVTSSFPSNLSWSPSKRFLFIRSLLSTWFWSDRTSGFWCWAVGLI